VKELLEIVVGAGTIRAELFVVEALIAGLCKSENEANVLCYVRSTLSSISVRALDFFNNGALARLARLARRRSCCSTTFCTRVSHSRFRTSCVVCILGFWAGQPQRRRRESRRS
jgi:hypothetical protein